MSAVVKISLDAVVENGINSLHILEKLNNHDDFEDLSISGLVDVPCECFNLTVQEITAVDEDGDIEELYKPSTIKYEFVKVDRKGIMIGDIVIIEGVDYLVTPLDGEKVTLYSHRFNRHYFEFIQSIVEIELKLQENDVKYEIYKFV